MKSDKISLEVEHNFTLNPELLQELGRLTTIFVGLEYWVVSSIDILIPYLDSNFSFRLLEGDNFVALLSKFKRIVKYQIRDKKLNKEFDELYKRIEKVRTKRNDVLHSLWILDKNSLIRIKLKSGTFKNKPVVFIKEPKNIDGIKAIVNEITDLVVALINFDNRIIEFLGNLRNK